MKGEYRKTKEAQSDQNAFVIVAVSIAITLVVLAHLIYLQNMSNLNKCVAFNSPDNQAIINCYFNE